MSAEKESNPELYAVYAEAQGCNKPLLQLELTFPRLIDDVIVPYETGGAFFIDGAPLTNSKLIRIKVLKLDDEFLRQKQIFNMQLTSSSNVEMKMVGEQYNIRFEHLLRQHSEDVTSQVLKAFNLAIKPSLKDYLPRRDELISSATKIFIESIKALNN